jgi:aquaporin Z
MKHNTLSRYMAEFWGTFLLVAIGCGSAIMAGGQIGYLGVSLAFGFTLLVLAYTLGPVSGCHLNPAVTLCMAITGRMQFANVVGYLASQLAGAAAAGYFLLVVASGKAGFDMTAGFALNGFAEHSPGGYSLMAALMAEAAATAVLLYVILCTTTRRFEASFGGLVVGVTLAVLHMLMIPVTNASLNIARSFGPALIHGGWALEQLWLFGVAHIAAIFVAITLFSLTQNDD